MAQYKKLSDAVKLYIKDEESYFLIPESHFWEMLKIWRTVEANRRRWTPHKAAAALLQLAFNDGYLQPCMLTPEGHQALTWADTFIDEIHLHLRQETLKAS